MPPPIRILYQCLIDALHVNMQSLSLRIAQKCAIFGMKDGGMKREALLRELRETARRLGMDFEVMENRGKALITAYG